MLLGSTSIIQGFPYVSQCFSLVSPCFFHVFLRFPHVFPTFSGVFCFGKNRRLFPSFQGSAGWPGRSSAPPGDRSCPPRPGAVQDRMVLFSMDFPWVLKHINMGNLWEIIWEIYGKWKSIFWKSFSRWVCNKLLWENCGKSSAGFPLWVEITNFYGKSMGNPMS